jgi:hypothetical protein
VRESLLVLVVCTALIIDIGCDCADRVLTAARTGTWAALVQAVDDWLVATGLAALVGLAAGGWAAAASVRPARRLARLTRPVGRRGPRGA